MVSRFGEFQVQEKGTVKTRNPATDREMMLNEKGVVKLKVAGGLKDRINGKKSDSS